MTTRIGIGSWTLPWAIGFHMNPYHYPKMSPVELIDFAESNDIHLVQLYNNIDLLALDKMELRQIEEHADACQIELAIGGFGIEEDYLRELIRIAEILGSRTVRTVIPLIEANASRYEVNRVAEILRAIISEFEQAGINLLVENHDRYTSYEYRNMLDYVSSDAIGICFDSANSLGKLEHFRESFRILKNHIYSSHFKEYSIKRVETNLGFIIEGCCPGEGENVSQEFYELMRSLDKEIDIVLEQWMPFQGSVEDTLRIERLWAEKGIQILKSLVAKENAN
jgi:sugar phosphate isomerase/epimerase